MFGGFTDWHSHILPGVDDGINTLAESLEVLKSVIKELRRIGRAMTDRHDRHPILTGNRHDETLPVVCVTGQIV